MNTPILYQEGKAHHTQRQQTARFFTPKAVSTNYRQLMETYADQLMVALGRHKCVDLSEMSMRMAVSVAAEVVGLTDSYWPRMDRRLDAFFENVPAEVTWTPSGILNFLSAQTRMLKFFLLDVYPAIQARKRAPREDVISHLLAQNYTPSEILTECVTYGAAGMVTTREFISLAAWHLLEHDALRAQYLAADESARYQILHEILRLEPIIGHIYRRATADITVSTGDSNVVIPEGALIDLHIHDANTDVSVVGDNPLEVCPARPLHATRAALPLMSFGDGNHRCPGAYIAIQETDIFLTRLLHQPGIRMASTPTLTWNQLVTGYEIRNVVIAID